MKTQTIITWILILVIIDQLIKIIIYNFYVEISFDIIPSLVEFKPTFNIKHSWINSLLSKQYGINVGLLPHVILYLLLGILVPMFFSYFRNKIAYNKKLIDTATIFMMAAILCALIGNLIWKKGTLDFIYLKSFFVFDLKDVYSDLAVVILLIYTLKNRKDLDQSTKGVKVREVFMETKNRYKKRSN